MPIFLPVRHARICARSTLTTPRYAVMLLVSHVLLFVQARRAMEDEREHTAQPHGINSMLLFAYLQLIIGSRANTFIGGNVSRSTKECNIHPPPARGQSDTEVSQQHNRCDSLKGGVGYFAGPDDRMGTTKRGFASLHGRFTVFKAQGEPVRNGQ